jgi:hypothetical protein
MHILAARKRRGVSDGDGASLTPPPFQTVRAGSRRPRLGPVGQ